MTTEANREQVSDGDVWDDGALRTPDAVKFSGIARTRLFELGAAGDLPYRVTGHVRLWPRRGLVQKLREGLK